MTHLTDEQLDAAANGDSGDATTAQHLSTCAQCQAAVAERVALRERLASLPQTIATSRDLWPHVAGAIRARRRRRLTVTAGSALALAAALLIAVVRLGGPPDSLPESTSVELAELKALVPPVVIEAMAANLTIYDAALYELETYAASDTDDADVQQRIDELRRKRAALLRRASDS